MNKQSTHINRTERFHERDSATPAASQTYYRVIYLFREPFSSDVTIGGEISRVLAGHRYSRRLVGQLHAVAHLVDLLPARPTALHKNEKPSPETKRGLHDSQKKLIVGMYFRGTRLALPPGTFRFSPRADNLSWGGVSRCGLVDQFPVQVAALNAATSVYFTLRETRNMRIIAHVRCASATCVSLHA